MLGAGGVVGFVTTRPVDGSFTAVPAVAPEPVLPAVAVVPGVAVVPAVPAVAVGRVVPVAGVVPAVPTAPVAGVAPGAVVVPGVATVPGGGVVGVPPVPATTGTHGTVGWATAPGVLDVPGVEVGGWDVEVGLAVVGGRWVEVGALVAGRCCGVALAIVAASTATGAKMPMRLARPAFPARDDLMSPPDLVFIQEETVQTTCRRNADARCVRRRRVGGP